MPDKTRWNDDEKKVFRKLGVANNQAALKQLIRGQRRINGKIFFALTEILKRIPKEELSAESMEALDEARSVVALIPGEDPPFCEEIVSQAGSK